MSHAHYTFKSSSTEAFPICQEEYCKSSPSVMIVAALDAALVGICTQSV